MLLFTGMQAQVLNIFSANPALNTAVETIIKDFPSKLSNSRGVAQPPEEGVFKSLVTIPGAANCTIKQYTAGKEMTCYWVADVLTTDDFNTAKKKYNELFRQLQACKFNGIGTGTVKLKGNKDAASEAEKINMVTFRLDKPAEQYSAIKVELSLAFVITEWQLTLTIHDRREDDAEPGVKE